MPIHPTMSGDYKYYFRPEISLSLYDTIVLITMYKYPVDITPEQFAINIKKKSKKELLGYATRCILRQGIPIAKEGYFSENLEEYGKAIEKIVAKKIGFDKYKEEVYNAVK